MSRIAIVAISRNGARLGRELSSALAPEAAFFVDRRFMLSGDNARPFDLPARPVVQQAFRDYESLVLLMPVGAAIRLLAPLLVHKHHDAGVVCVDDSGTFAVSLLSGHVGGADRLTRRVAEIIGATPVITSASHTGRTIAVDLLGRDLGWTLEADSTTVTRASAAVVNGDPVGVYYCAGVVQLTRDWQPTDLPLPANIHIFASLETLAVSQCTAALVISDQLWTSVESRVGYAESLPGKATVVYRPKSLVVGMGCRRGVPMDELEALLDETLEQNNLARASVRCIATAEIKRDEGGLLLLAEKLGVSLECYGVEELNSMFENGATPALVSTQAGESVPGLLRPTPSPVAHRLLGVWGVSEPAALLSSGAQDLLVTRQKTTRATIAVARIQLP